MILSFLEFSLSPLISLLSLAFDGLILMTGSVGWSIVLLSCLTTLVSQPLRKWAQRIESRVSSLKDEVDEKVASSTLGLRGELKFRAVEQVYRDNEYHPIMSVALGAPFFVMLPFLLSALFVLFENPALESAYFLFIADLSLSDRALAGVNVLPFFMTGVTLLDAYIRFGINSSSFRRFIFISLVLFFLVYNLASGIVLYWCVSNLAALVGYISRKSS
jgi:YidC/Oxa1 family membrane protein insertase